MLRIGRPSEKQLVTAFRKFLDCLLTESFQNENLYPL